jgi:hypothetical protein
VHKALEYLIDLFLPDGRAWNIDQRVKLSTPMVRLSKNKKGVFKFATIQNQKEEVIKSARNRSANLIKVFCNANNAMLDCADALSTNRNNYVHPPKGTPPPNPSLKDLCSYFEVVAQIAQGIQSHP